MKETLSSKIFESKGLLGGKIFVKDVRGFIDRYLDKLWKKRYCKSEEGFERWEEIVNTLIEEAGEELIK